MGTDAVGAASETKPVESTVKAASEDVQDFVVRPAEDATAKDVAAATKPLEKQELTEKQEEVVDPFDPDVVVKKVLAPAEAEKAAEEESTQPKRGTADWFEKRASELESGHYDTKQQLARVERLLREKDESAGLDLDLEPSKKADAKSSDEVEGLKRDNQQLKASVSRVNDELAFIQLVQRDSGASMHKRAIFDLIKESPTLTVDKAWDTCKKVGLAMAREGEERGIRKTTTFYKELATKAKGAKSAALSSSSPGSSGRTMPKGSPVASATDTDALKALRDVTGGNQDFLKKI